jgi:hypothetical protein
MSLPPARPDALWAIAAGAAAFAVYLRTLAPGMVAVTDTPMFQFIGRVLGVPHNPGYPLYVLLTFPFSYLPIGSLAYRINLFSAICGALTVSLTFLIARRLGCRRIVSAAAALGMAFGHIFWSQSIIAEVYTLDSAIVAGMLLALLAWGQTGQPVLFFTAVALLAAGVGNHTTIVGFAPGMALYALLKHRRFALRSRTIAMTALILSAGVAQYVFIIIRSRQPGTYLESRATNVVELVGVMSGQQFSNRLFAFDWRTVVFKRIPQLIEQILIPELTLPGVVLALVGAAWLLRRRFPEGVLFLLGAAAIVIFALNYSVVDTPVFLIPATFVLWVAIAVGTEQTSRTLERSRWAATAVVAAAVVLPIWHLARNFTVTDRSRDRAAAVIFDSLFKVLPDRSAIVHEDFLIDRMVMFKLLGDRAAGTRQVDVAPRDATAILERHKAGFKVFGFQKSIRRLRYDALNFSFARLPLTDRPLAEFLRDLPDGSVVAVLVPAIHSERLAASGISLATIGGTAGVTPGIRKSLAIVGARGARAGALVTTSPANLHVELHAGQEIGDTGVNVPAAIEVRSDGFEAAIRQGSRDVVRTRHGAVMAVWNVDGELDGTFVMEADDDFRLPIPSNSLSVYPLRGVWPSQTLSIPEWTDVSNATRTGTTMLKVPAESTVVIYLASDVPLAPRAIDRSSSRLRHEITAFRIADRAALLATLDTDRVNTSRVAEAAYAYRITVTASEAASVLTALGGVPVQAIGRVVRGRAAATIFQVDTMGLLRRPDRASEVLLMTRDDQSQLTGEGWSPVDSDAVSAYRWMTATEARLLLPTATRDARRIRIQALLEEGGAPGMVGLRVNGIEVPSQPLRRGWNSYEWTIPGGLAEPLANDVVITIDRLSPPKNESPSRGIAVTELRVIHE